MPARLPDLAQEEAARGAEPQLVVRHTFLSVVGGKPRSSLRRKARTTYDLPERLCVLDLDPLSSGSEAETVIPDDTHRTISPASDCLSMGLCDSADDEARPDGETQARQAEASTEASAEAGTEAVAAAAVLVVKNTFLDVVCDLPAGGFRRAVTDPEFHCPGELQCELTDCSTQEPPAAAGEFRRTVTDTELHRPGKSQCELRDRGTQEPLAAQECGTFCATPYKTCWRDYEACAGLAGASAFGTPKANAGFRSCPARSSPVAMQAEACELGHAQEESGPSLLLTPEARATPKDNAAGSGSGSHRGGRACSAAEPPAWSPPRRASESFPRKPTRIPAQRDLPCADWPGSDSASSDGPKREPKKPWQPATLEALVSESIGGRKKGAAPRPRGDQRTTIMMRNIPNNYTRDMVLQMLNDRGFAGGYDFLYLPIDFTSGACLGYAFVNLANPSLVASFWKTFDGYCQWKMPTTKVCELSWSRPYQGLRANVMRYKNSSVMHESVSDDYKPCIFINGIRAPFPKSTRMLRPPTA